MRLNLREWLVSHATTDQQIDIPGVSLYHAKLRERHGPEFRAPTFD